MKLGIVGLPNVGKTTLFNAIMKTGAESARYPFSTVKPNIAMVPVPDHRIRVLADMYAPKSVVPAVVEMVDIAGLVKGSGRGEGLGSQFLSHIREVDALVHVVRCFVDENVPHAYEDIDPVRDIETIDLELIFADLDVIARRLERVAKDARTDKTLLAEQSILLEMQNVLEQGVPLRIHTANGALPEFDKIALGLKLLTYKPVLYALNIGESDIGAPKANHHVAKAQSYALESGSSMFVSCAKLECEISAMETSEIDAFMAEMGLEANSLDNLIAEGYALLGLVSFLTAGPKEVRAWTIKAGSKASQAAGKIHSDLERGFIRAEVVSFDDLQLCGSYNVAKERGLVRSEGKEYIVKDGDVLLVRFNV